MKQKVNTGVKNGFRLEASTTKIETYYATGTVTDTESSLNSLKAWHMSSVAIPTTKPWVHPTPWSVFAITCKGEPFDYQWYVVGRTIQRVSSDNTDRIDKHGLPGSIAYTGLKIAGGTYVPDVSQNMRNRVLAQAAANLRDMKVQAATSFAEARKTASFIRDIWSSLAKAFIALRKGNIRAAFKHLTSRSKIEKTTTAKYYSYHTGRDKAKSSYQDWNYDRKTRQLGKNSVTSKVDVPRRMLPHEAWLEYNYAFLPLMRELLGMVELLSKHTENGVVIKGRSRIQENYGLPTRPPGMITWRTGGTIKVGAECQLRATVNSSYLYTASQAGLTTGDALLTAWELLPYSFVIDWLIPIGTLLESMGSSMGLTFLDGYVGTKAQGQYTAAGCRKTKISGSDPSVSYQMVSHTRDPQHHFPFPGLYVKSPFSTSHVVSATSLLANLMLKRQSGNSRL